MTFLKQYISVGRGGIFFLAKKYFLEFNLADIANDNLLISRFLQMAIDYRGTYRYYFPCFCFSPKGRNTINLMLMLLASIIIVV